MNAFDFTPYAVGGATRPDSFTGLNPEMRSRLAAMLTAAEAELGPRALTITSAYRSPELQAQLYQNALKKYGSPEKARKWVAPPGRSQHNFGTAVDFASASGGLLRDANSPEARWLKENAERFGLAVPMEWEPWQVELAGARSSNVAPSPIAPSQDTLVGDMGSDTLEPDVDLQSFAASLLEQDDALRQGQTEQPQDDRLSPAEAYASTGALDPSSLAASLLEQDDALRQQPIVPRPFVPGEEMPAEQPSRPLREKFSAPSFEAMGQAASGLAGGEGLVEVPESVPLMREGGAEVSFPEPVRNIGNFLGDALMTAASAGSGAYGYLAGGIGDLLVGAGVMGKSTADRLVGDLMAVPESLAGTPGVVTTAPRLATTARTTPEAPQPRVEPPPLARPVTTQQPVTRIETPDFSEDARIGELIRKGAGFGIGARRAREELALLSKQNSEASVAAERLGIDLPIDVLADNRQIKEAIGATRAIAGTEASSVWRETVTRATDDAQKAMKELAGATDVSTVSAQVLNRLEGTRDNLRTQASRLYDEVDNAVPRNTIFEPNNIVKALNEVIGELGGPEGMTSAERQLFNLVTGDQPVTYRRLMREKDQIGRALSRQDGPYGDVNQADLTKLYAAISEDQLANVQRVGGEELGQNLKLANDLFAQSKGFEAQILSAFGKDLEGSIATKLRTAVSTAARGDVSGLKRVIKVVPEDLRREAVASAISELATSKQDGVRGFGFAQFADFYSGLRRNPEAYKEVAKAIGPESEAVLRDMFEISRRITEARGFVSTTGKSNQPLIQAMKAEGFLGRVLSSTAGQRGVRAAGTATGGVSGGLAGGMLGDALGDVIAAAKPDRMRAADRLFRNDDFKQLVVQMSSREVVDPKAINRVANSPQYRKWAATVGIEDPRAWLQAAIVTTATSQSEE